MNKSIGMKKLVQVLLLSIVFMFSNTLCLKSQVGANITSWKINTTGQKGQYYASNGTTVNNLNDSTEVLKVCYNADTVWVRASLLPGFIIGPWPGDPFIAAAQNKSYIFPRNPAYPTTNHPTKNVGAQALLINGVIAYDDADGKSYSTSTGKNENNGGGIWNQIAWVAHISEVDAGNGHPDPHNTYHNHHNPIKLCSVTSGTAHSPLIGWAFDGNPIYGPFGYSTPTNTASAIKRMTPSWALRSISTRTALYTGSVTSQAGPAISAQFPLGTYIEDYGYTANSGDLDFYNGRYCYTPEFPNGTYAYFLNTDNSGNPQYPNMIGPKYYGSIFAANFGPTGGNASAPKSSKVCYTSGGTGTVSAVPMNENGESLVIFPNPASDKLTLQFEGALESIFIYNSEGKIVYTGHTSTNVIDIQHYSPGIYFVVARSNQQTEVRQRFVKQ